MNEKQKTLMRNVLKYNARRAYIGKFTADDLDRAHGTLRRTQNLKNPINTTYVHVGHIDGNVICRALWNEMSYNPLRFGSVSPFLLGRQDAIYRFCDHKVPENTPGFEILETIRHKLIDYMSAMPNADGGWNPDINDNEGWVSLGHYSAMYKKLTLLRKVMHIVATQNIQDFNRKAYREEMLPVIANRHPRGIRSNAPITYIQKPIIETPQMTDDEWNNDRLDDAIDNAQITLDNQQYVSPEQYEQALNDMVAMTNMKTNGFSR